NANPEINEIHLNYVLINNSDSIVSQVLKTMGVDVEKYRSELEIMIDKLPSQNGSANIYPTTVFQRILLKSEDEAKSMNDSFISTEHIFLALLKEMSLVSDLNKKYSIKYKDFKKSVLN